MININNLNKSFGDNVVLKDINLTFEIGKMYAVLGRNGVGKTTLFKIINRRFNKTSGDINYNSLLNKNILDISGSYTGLDAMTMFNSIFSVKTTLKSFKKYNPNMDLEYAFSLLEKFKLNPKTKLVQMNKSQKNILSFIITLCSNKTILIFDEPIQNVDLEFRNIFYKELLSLFMKNKHLILISTHIINEIENIITDVVILKDNIVVVNEEVDTLKERLNNKSLEEIFMLEVDDNVEVKL